MNANSEKLVLAYHLEATKGVVPAASTFQAVPRTGGSIKPGIQRSRPNQLRTDGQAAAADITDFDPNADLQFLLQAKCFDDLIAAALRGTWTADLGVTGSDIQVISGNKYSSTAVDIAADLWVGRPVFVGGYTNENNNGWKFVKAIDSTKVFEVYDTLTVEAAPGAATMKGKVLQNSTEVPTIALLAHYQDLTTKALLAKGLAIGAAQLGLSPRGYVTGSFRFAKGMALEALTTAHGHTITPEVNTRPISEVTGINDFWIDYLSPTAFGLAGVQMNINKNVWGDRNLGALANADVHQGNVSVGGQMSVYVNDDTWDLRSKAYNGTEMSFAWAI